MSKIITSQAVKLSLSRRRFVQGLAAGGTLLGLGLNPDAASAEVLHSCTRA